MRQGQQKYPSLVWQASADETSVDLHLSQKEIDEKYPNAKLAPHMEGQLHRLIGKVFKGLTDKKVFAGHVFENYL